MKFKFTTATILILFSATYCRAGLFDKLNNAINSPISIVNTNTPNQGTATNQPLQNIQVTNTNAAVPVNDTVKTPQPSADAVLQTNNAESQSGQTANALSQNVKAYKTLVFGDNTVTVEKKLPEIIVGAQGTINDDNNLLLESETFWRSLFDSDAEYEPYKYDHTHGTQSDKLQPLMRYFKEKVGVGRRSLGNSAIDVDCYLLGVGLNTTHPKEHGGLAIVEVTYRTSDISNLVETFMQNFPDAQKKNRSYRVESTLYPGVFLEFERTLFSDVNQDRRATLSIPTGKFTFLFTELSKLSEDQLALWDKAMTQDGKTKQRNEYYESMKTSLLGFAKDTETEKPTQLILDPLTYQGWYEANGEYEPIIFGAPCAVFASKTILDSHMNKYRQTVEAKDKADKAKLKKESESSTGF
ncbi:MAG: hypothetical protein WBN75_15535 [Verrucomicrobiia bacterium]